MRQKLIELYREIDESTIIIGDFNRPLSEMDKYTRQEISKDMVKLNHTKNQQDIMDMYSLRHPTTTEYIFQAHMKHSSRRTKIWAIKNNLTNLKEQKP